MSGKVEGFCCQAPTHSFLGRGGRFSMSGKVEGFCCQAPSGPRLRI